MATYVLVPGLFAGGWSWKFVVPILRGAGHEAHAVTLTGMGDRSHLAHPDVGISTHVQDIVSMIEYEDLDDIILVGWSYGGILVGPVAHQVPERIRHIVVLDADLIPKHGQSVYDINPDYWEQDEPLLLTGNGWQIPPPPESAFEQSIPDADRRKWLVSRLTPALAKTQSEGVQMQNDAASSIPCTLIRCTQSTFWNNKAGTRMLKDVQSRQGWEVIELEGNHLAPVAQPVETAEALLQVIRPKV